MARRQPSVRRIRGELKATMRSYLESRGGRSATIAEIQAAAEKQFGPVPPSSVRSGLQDDRYFERVARGVFRPQSAS